ncbi:MAG: DUF4105 domain-containing protein [bacterium]
MRRRAILALAVALAAAAAFAHGPRASNDRDWSPPQSRLARATFAGDTVTIENVRDFDHCPESGPPIERWHAHALDLRALDSVWLVLSPFERDNRGPAHPFLSFGFGDSAYVSISVEARRERNEEYSIWRGMLGAYEIQYVVAEERDVIPLRVICRDDDVYLYPIRTSPERARRLFEEMLARANELADRPELYHTIFKSCSSTLLKHANRVTTKQIPGGWRVMLPGYSDEVVHAVGLIDEAGTMEEIRARSLVNDRVKRFAGAPDFSHRIRTTDPGLDDG